MTEQAPLSEVVPRLFASAAQLRALDEEINRKLRAIERRLGALGVRRVVRAQIVDGVELAWSAKRGRWRLVIRDEGGVVDLLFDAEFDERLEVLLSGALSRLIAQIRRST